MAEPSDNPSNIDNPDNLQVADGPDGERKPWQQSGYTRKRRNEEFRKPDRQRYADERKIVEAELAEMGLSLNGIQNVDVADLQLQPRFPTLQQQIPTLGEQASYTAYDVRNAFFDWRNKRESEVRQDLQDRLNLDYYVAEELVNGYSPDDINGETYERAQEILFAFEIEKEFQLRRMLAGLISFERNDSSSEIWSDENSPSSIEEELWLFKHAHRNDTLSDYMVLRKLYHLEASVESALENGTEESLLSPNPTLGAEDVQPYFNKLGQITGWQSRRELLKQQLSPKDFDRWDTYDEGDRNSGWPEEIQSVIDEVDEYLHDKKQFLTRAMLSGAIPIERKDDTPLEDFEGEEWVLEKASYYYDHDYSADLPYEDLRYEYQREQAVESFLEQYTDEESLKPLISPHPVYAAEDIFTTYSEMTRRQEWRRHELRTGNGKINELRLQAILSGALALEIKKTVTPSVDMNDEVRLLQNAHELDDIIRLRQFTVLESKVDAVLENGSLESLIGEAPVYSALDIHEELEFFKQNTSWLTFSEKKQSLLIHALLSGEIEIEQYATENEVANTPGSFAEEQFILHYTGPDSDPSFYDTIRRIYHLGQAVEEAMTENRQLDFSSEKPLLSAYDIGGLRYEVERCLGYDSDKRTKLDNASEDTEKEEINEHFERREDIVLRALLSNVIPIERNPEEANHIASTFEEELWVCKKTSPRKMRIEEYTNLRNQYAIEPVIEEMQIKSTETEQGLYVFLPDVKRMVEAGVNSKEKAYALFADVQQIFGDFKETTDPEASSTTYDSFNPNHILLRAGMIAKLVSKTPGLEHLTPAKATAVSEYLKEIVIADLKSKVTSLRHSGTLERTIKKEMAKTPDFLSHTASLGRFDEVVGALAQRGHTSNDISPLYATLPYSLKQQNGPAYMQLVRLAAAERKQAKETTIPENSNKNADSGIALAEKIDAVRQRRKPTGVKLEEVGDEGLSRKPSLEKKTVTSHVTAHS